MKYFPPGVRVHCHPKGWMDQSGMKLWVEKLWVEKVWRSRPGGLLRKKSLLIWDSFQAHRVDSVKRAERQTNTDIAVIPSLSDQYSSTVRRFPEQAI